MHYITEDKKVNKLRSQLLAIVYLLIAFAVPASAAPDCTAINQAPVFHVVNPKTKANLLTVNAEEARLAKELYGFTDDRGTLFYAAKEWTSGSGLSLAYRLFHPGNNDFLWTISQSEVTSAINSYGYSNNGGNFFVSSVSADCTQPVYRYRYGAMHRYAVTQAEQNKLIAEGWIYEGLHFYAGKGNQNPNPSGVFSMAVLPDTQQEVLRPQDDFRFRQRMEWLVNNRNTLNLRYVMHSGDVVNWGERDVSQYGVAASAYDVLRAAGIPFLISVGNHDTRAVCAGGSACPGQDTHKALRELPLFNSASGFLNLMQPHVAGWYAQNDLSNVYGRFEAGGLKWLVLSLELWPRAAVVEWAKSVVAANPTYNVIVVTHSFLTANGTIYTSGGGYGDMSPQYLYDNLIKAYPNIRFVFSGHEGEALVRTFTGSKGNKIVAATQCFHSGTTNPVRVMEIDTAKNTFKTYIALPRTNEYWRQYDYETSGMNFVR